jgi:hypothetical protein
VRTDQEPPEVVVADPDPLEIVAVPLVVVAVDDVVVVDDAADVDAVDVGAAWVEPVVEAVLVDPVALLLVDPVALLASDADRVVVALARP